MTRCGFLAWIHEEQRREANVAWACKLAKKGFEVAPCSREGAPLAPPTTNAAALKHYFTVAHPDAKIGVLQYSQPGVYRLFAPGEE